MMRIPRIVKIFVAVVAIYLIWSIGVTKMVHPEEDTNISIRVLEVKKARDLYEVKIEYQGPPIPVKDLKVSTSGPCSPVGISVITQGIKTLLYKCPPGKMVWIEWGNSRVGRRVMG